MDSLPDLSPMSLSARSNDIKPMFFFKPVARVDAPALRMSLARMDRLVRVQLYMIAHPSSTAQEIRSRFIRGLLCNKKYGVETDFSSTVQ